jgi:hypothetical protein
MKRLRFLACLAVTIALAVEPDADRVRALVKQLGADTFKEREAAQKELSAMPRSVVPVLREFENTKDPEIRERLQTVIHTILTDASRMPLKVHVYQDGASEKKAAGHKMGIEELVKGSLSTCHTNGRSSASGDFAQRFVPHGHKVGAIVVQIYSSSSMSGWLSLDLRADKDGRPDSGVLARSWLRIEKNHPSRSSYAVFPLPDTALEPEKPYWFTVTQHPDPNQKGRAMTSHRFDPKTDTKEFRLLRFNNEPSGCVNFFLLADCPTLSWLREAGEEERKTLPTLPASDFEWWNRRNPRDE